MLDDGTGNDDHPHADIREHVLFLHNLFQAVANGAGWSSTVIVFTFDEWGGFFDHVAPPRATAPNLVDADVVGGKELLGFWLPVVIAFPFARGDAKNPRIRSLVYDRTSVLKMIKWRWGLAPLTPRDASSDISNLAYALNFSQPQTAVPSLPTPFAPAIAVPCFQNAHGIFSTAKSGSDASPAGLGEKWGELQTQAAQYGFP